MTSKNCDFSELLGQQLVEINGAVGDEEMTFLTTSGKKYMLYHQQDCCESVSIEDICGDLDDLLDSPLLMAEEVNNAGDDLPEPEYCSGSYTWTFYKLATVKGYVTIRWYGTSNGYYSESVDFVEL